MKRCLAPADAPLIHSNATLVVGPKTALPVWKALLAEHIHPGMLSLYEFVDRNRIIAAKDLVEYDVVTASYQEVAAQVRRLRNRKEVIGQKSG